MKKTLSLLAALAVMAPLSVKAESSSGGLELSGNVDVVTGWQRDDSHAFGTTQGGGLGDFRGATSAKRDTFNFYLDQVELDLNKSLGENIRIRADIDFGRVASGSNRTGEGANVVAEQAYVTFGVGGAEVAVGRFNAPIGYYSVDRADNITLSYSDVYKYTTPANVTGAKVYYAFTDMVDLSVYVVNSLADGDGFSHTGSALPSYGMRLGLNWGDEGQKSTVGLSYAGGPERAGHNKHLTNIGDLDFNVKLTPEFTIAGEFLYRQDNSIIPGNNDKVWGGYAVLNYDIDEAWRVFARAGYLQDRSTTAQYTGFNSNNQDYALGVGYQITDGAKLKLEYSLGIADLRGVSAKANMSHAVAAELAYNF